MVQNPAGASFALIAGMEALSPSWDLVCTGSKDKILEELESLDLSSIPNLSIIIKTPENAAALQAAAPFTANYPMPDTGSPSLYYLCIGETCLQPCEIDTLRELTSTEKIDPDKNVQ